MKESKISLIIEKYHKILLGDICIQELPITCISNSVGTYFARRNVG